MFHLFVRSFVITYGTFMLSDYYMVTKALLDQFSIDDGLIMVTQSIIKAIQFNDKETFDGTVTIINVCFS